MAEGQITSMSCEAIHDIFNNLPRYAFPFDGQPIPANGIYILFEKGEQAHGCDRIVRVGTHTGQGNLQQRLIEHFLHENKDRSIFRKNIGRALLAYKDDQFIIQWEVDLTTTSAKQRYSRRIDFERLSQVEKDVSAVIRDTFTFCVFPVEDKHKRLDFEERIIATVNQCGLCRPSTDWLGNHSPKKQIRESGLWLVQGLKGATMDHEDLETLKTMTAQIGQA